MADRIGQTGEGRQRQEVKETRRQETRRRETRRPETGRQEKGDGRQKKRDRRWETEDGRQRDGRWFSDVISGKKLYF